MIYVTSDLHGYPLESFLQLLESASFSDTDDLIILGDVIDRKGDGGIAILRWMLQQVNVRMILGNHEAMLLACKFLFETITDESIEQFDQRRMSLLSTWMMNGAEPTIKALRDLFREDEDTAREILEYLDDSPLYEYVDVSGRRYLLTHSGLGNFEPGKKFSQHVPEDLLWNRPKLTDRYFEKTTTIFGHTPTAYFGEGYKHRMLKTATWIDIDTGAANGEGWHPMLLRLDDEKPFYVQGVSHE